MSRLGGVGVGVGLGVGVGVTGLVVVGPTPPSISPIFKLELSNFKSVKLLIKS